MSILFLIECEVSSAFGILVYIKNDIRAGYNHHILNIKY